MSPTGNGVGRWSACCVERGVSRLDPLGQYSAKVHNVAAPKGGEQASTTHKQIQPKTRTELPARRDQRGCHQRKHWSGPVPGHNVCKLEKKRSTRGGVKRTTDEAASASYECHKAHWLQVATGRNEITQRNTATPVTNTVYARCWSHKRSETCVSEG